MLTSFKVQLLIVGVSAINDEQTGLAQVDVEHYTGYDHAPAYDPYVNKSTYSGQAFYDNLLKGYADSYNYLDHHSYDDSSDHYVAPAYHTTSYHDSYHTSSYHDPYHYSAPEDPYIYNHTSSYHEPSYHSYHDPYDYHVSSYHDDYHESSYHDSYHEPTYYEPSHNKPYYEPYDPYKSTYKEPTYQDP